MDADQIIALGVRHGHAIVRSNTNVLRCPLCYCVAASGPRGLWEPARWMMQACVIGQAAVVVVRYTAYRSL